MASTKAWLAPRSFVQAEHLDHIIPGPPRWPVRDSLLLNWQGFSRGALRRLRHREHMRERDEVEEQQNAREKKQRRVLLGRATVTHRPTGRWITTARAGRLGNTRRRWPDNMGHLSRQRHGLTGRASGDDELLRRTEAEQRW
jgi:hypothetical protein